MTPAWVNILAAAGWPTDVVVLDFECYFDSVYSLKKLSTIEYVTDPRWEELGVAVVRMPGAYPYSPLQGSFWVGHERAKLYIDWLRSTYGPNLEGCTVVGHNLAFDGTVLARHHNLIPKYMIDTLGLARHVNPHVRNDLAHLCDRYKLKAKGDTSQFSGMHWSMRLGPPTWDEDGEVHQEVIRKGMDPQTRLDLCAYAKNDAEREFELFTILLPMLSRPAFELDIMRHTLGLFLDPCIAVDFDLGGSLIAQMDAKAVTLVARTGHTAKEISGNISFEKLLRKQLGDATPMKQGKKQMILAISKTDPEREELLQHFNPVVQTLMEARVGLKSWPLHTKRVQGICAQAKAAGGLIPVSLKYMGAHTGRWAGGEGINLHNLGARSTEPLVNQVRELLVVVEGEILVITDAAQIEARVLGWIAGQWDLVRRFANGEPIYCQFASEIVGEPVRKVTKDDPPDVVKTMTRYRNLGKVGVLGCGFGMGWRRCLEYARDVYHVDIDAALAKKIVEHYRATNQKITKFWRDLEARFKFVTRYPHEVQKLDRGLVLWREGDTTIITLPCGRNLRYPEAGFRMHMGYEELGWPNPLTKSWTRAWGGFLTENIVQAMSRDILAEAILMSEDQGEGIGLRIGHHVHDEMIGVVREEHGPAALEIQLEALRTRPVWAPDCPLDAEGFLTKKYGK